ncbi:MAG: hypothetical protein KatS3mg105_3279 [Gemmatales bacterium]|nr:MAG: hypothetical protein KatS3mg105_3279 [Gemmatales bacterium]
MAGDWIPWIKGLTVRREVIAIAAAVGRDRRWVASVMMEAWSWADSESTDGFIPAVKEPADLTLIIPDTSAEFWSAVEAVGWLRFRNGGVEFPNFNRYMGSTAKKTPHRVRQEKRVSAATKRRC